MAQVAKNRYASQQYHDFIGFKVSKPLLERAFPVVYGLELKDVLAHEDLAIGSYRFSVSRLIPQMTQVALQIHKKDLKRETPNFAKRKFLYRLSRSDYEKEWGKDYVKPGLGTRILSTLLRYMPKIGPFKKLGFNNPTPQTADLYIKSINATVDQYRAFLEAVRTDTLVLPNYDFDTGNPTRARNIPSPTTATPNCWPSFPTGSSIWRPPICGRTSCSFIPTSRCRSRPKRTRLTGRAC